MTGAAAAGIAPGSDGSLKRVLEEAHGTRRFEAHLERATPDRCSAEPLVPLARLLERRPTAAEAAENDAPHEDARFNLAEPTNESDGTPEEGQPVVRQQGLERWNELVVAYGHRGLRVAGGRRRGLKRAPMLFKSCDRASSACK